jgi:hypothetical protein
MSDDDAAAAHHREALAAAVIANEPAALALALEGAASLLVHADPQRAARLLGAAQGLWAGASAALTRTHRDDVARITLTAREALGDSGFESAVQAGLRLDRSMMLAAARAAPATTD